jgi:hypothetical protein
MPSPVSVYYFIMCRFRPEYSEKTRNRGGAPCPPLSVFFASSFFAVSEGVPII